MQWEKTDEVAAATNAPGPEPEPELNREVPPANRALDHCKEIGLQANAGADVDLGSEPEGITYYVLSPTTVFETLEDVLGGAEAAGSLAAGGVLFALEQVCGWPLVLTYWCPRKPRWWDWSHANVSRHLATRWRMMLEGMPCCLRTATARSGPQPPTRCVSVRKIVCGRS